MSVREEIRRLINTESAQHKRLIEYVVRQLHTGRNLQDVMDDPYVTNRSKTIDRRALLEEPEVVDAAGEGSLQSMRAQLEAELGA
ncbi:MAG TPA: hypothetical protein VFG74_12940 [Miltoncostaeaceae bacterium]|jgi:hypothetical protein|nr:hypothetical protein [Miltoncostaeaceae bacterium]